MNSIQKNYICNIQIIKTFSCIAILITHIGGWIIDQQSFFYNYVSFAAEAVRNFFVISGYLMCFSKELEKSNFFIYYIKRAFKIIPIYYVVIICYMILHYIVLKDVPKDTSGLYWIRYFCFISTSVPAEDIFWNNLGATWTISYFLMFYLLAPLLYKVCTNFKKTFVVMLILMSLMILPNGILEPAGGLYSFAIGILIYHSIQEHKEFEAIVVFAILCVIFNVGGYAYPHGDTFILAVIILCFLKLNIKKNKLRLFWREIEFVDEHSYTIYLVHPFIISIILIYGEHLNGWLKATLVVFCSMFISYILDMIIGNPCNSVRNHILKYLKTKDSKVSEGF